MRRPAKLEGLSNTSRAFSSGSFPLRSAVSNERRAEDPSVQVAKDSCAESSQRPQRSPLHLLYAYNELEKRVCLWSSRIKEAEGNEPPTPSISTHILKIFFVWHNRS